MGILRKLLKILNLVCQHVELEMSLKIRIQLKNCKKNNLNNTKNFLMNFF